MNPNALRLRKLLIRLVLTVLILPGSFIIMSVFDLNMNDKFISGNDGSTGPAFTTFLWISSILFILIWFHRPLIRIGKWVIAMTGRVVNK